MNAQLDRLKGSIPPLVTPFTDGEVDYDAYARLVAFQIKSGSHGILVNGTTAEPSTLSLEERNRLVDIAVQVAAKRVPVIAATGSQSLRDTRHLSEHAAQAGADALLIVTPYYIRPPQRGLIAYYLQLASTTDLHYGSPLDGLPHPRTGGGQRDHRYSEGAACAVALLRGHEARGE